VVLQRRPADGVGGASPGPAGRVRHQGSGCGGAGGAGVPGCRARAGADDGEWLGRWLASRVSLRSSTSRSYAAHARGYLVPYLGTIPLEALSAGDVQAMFIAIARDETALGRPVSAATLHRIHATLRAALNGAVRAGLITVNPGRWPELPKAARPRPQVWTPALTEQWKREGWRPVVGVWTAAQTSEFLRQVRGHRLYALFHLVALRGLRRGEAAGLRWSDLDLDARTLTVSEQLQQLGGRLATAPPKSDAGRRVIALDKTTINALREHKARQLADGEVAGARWAESGYVFTTLTGKPLGPDRLTRLFRKLVAASGLPPVTLHGLRHGAATLAPTAGADLKVVQDQLGHSTIVLTADTYTSVLPETARTAADLTAALLFPVRRPPAGRGKPTTRRLRKQALPAWARRRRGRNHTGCPSGISACRKARFPVAPGSSARRCGRLCGCDVPSVYFAWACGLPRVRYYCASWERSRVASCPSANVTMTLARPPMAPR
jgi:integrase